MELQIPGLNLVLQELQDLKEMVKVLDPMVTEEKYIPKTRMSEMFDLSNSTLRNREMDGSLTMYKIGVRTYYKLSDIHSMLENTKVNHGEK